LTVGLHSGNIGVIGRTGGEMMAGALRDSGIEGGVGGRRG
jgi:hypothetical protein